MKKAVLVPGSFFSTQPLKPGVKIRSDEIVELHALDRLLNDGWEVVSVTANPGPCADLGGDASYLIILEKK